MDAAARSTIRRWEGLPTIDVASEMSALALDVVERALFGADLVAQAPSLGRAFAAGQWLALLGAFLPISWGRNRPGWSRPRLGGSGPGPSSSRWKG